MRLRIGEPYHVVYYAPLHVAHRGGYFERAGLDVEIVPAASFAELLAQWKGQERRIPGAGPYGVDIAVGGIMRSLVAFDRGEHGIPVHFARVNDRDGFFLLGREPAFDWTDLLGRRLIVFAEAPTPWQVLRAMLLGKGLDPDRIQVVADVPIDAVAMAFRNGIADFALTQAHVAEELTRAGDAVILRAMAEEVGALPYSSYYCAPDYLELAPEVIAGVARAHAATMRWIRAHTGDEIWDTIRPAFADGDAELLRAATVRYKALGTWDSDTTLPLPSYDALATAMKAGGLVRRVAPYDLVIRDEAAREAEAGMIPCL